MNQSTDYLSFVSTHPRLALGAALAGVMLGSFAGSVLSWLAWMIWRAGV